MRAPAGGNAGRCNRRRLRLAPAQIFFSRRARAERVSENSTVSRHSELMLRCDDMHSFSLCLLRGLGGMGEGNGGVGEVRRMRGGRGG